MKKWMLAFVFLLPLMAWMSTAIVFATETAYAETGEDATNLTLSLLSGEQDFSSVRRGDINGDGEITQEDSDLLSKAVVGIVSLDEQQTYAADLNGDGKISVGDVSIMGQYLSGSITRFPVEIVAKGFCGSEGNGESLTWLLDDSGVLEIGGTGAMANYDNANAASLAPWHQYGESVTEIAIGDAVTALGSHAFRDLTRLDSVTLPAGITEVSNSLFACCYGLKQIVLPASVTLIDEYAFSDCTGLTGFNFPAHLSEIGKSAFWGCTNLTSVAIPSNVNSISECAFYNCNKLASVTISGNITSVGGSAFSGCSSLKEINLPNSITSIGNSAFRNCSSLMKVGIPTELETIENSVFAQCAKLESILLPDNIVSVGSYAFDGCTQLERIEFSKNLRSIGAYAFRNCSAVKTVIFCGNAPQMGDNALPTSNFSGYYPKTASGWSSISQGSYSYADWTEWDDTLPTHDIILVLDVSDSMNKGNKLETLKQAVGSLLNQLNGRIVNTRIALISFNNEPTKIATFSSDIKNLISETNKLTARGGTIYSSALNFADNLFNESEADMKSLVFFSDGQPLSRDKTEEINKAATSVREKATLYTVGLIESDTQREILRGVAGTDERYFEVDNIDVLADVLSDVFRRRVTFNADGGTVEPETVKVSYGHQIKEGISALPTPTKQGYSFLGWFTASGEEVSDDFLDTALTENITLTARWEPIQFHITFDPNGGTLVSNTTNLPGAERTGYTFDGWFTAKNGGTQITESAELNLTSDITLYAHWTPKQFTVTFDANGGSEPNPKELIVTYDAAYGTLPTTTRTGYTFDGWFTAKDGGTLIQATSVVKLTANTTLYAHWTRIECTITLNANGGTVNPSTLKVYYGESCGDLPTPTRTGYNFDGWLTSADNQIPNPITSDIQLYAHWTPKQFTVTFDANGGSEPNPKTLTVTFDAPYGTLPTTTRTGYTFDGWFTAKDTGTQIKAADTVKLTANTTLYAHWTPKQFTVQFNANGGSEPNPKTLTVTYDAPYGTLPATSRTGYKFLGWFTSADDGTQIQETSVVKLTEDITLYAHWERIECTITLNANKGTVSPDKVKVYYGESCGNLPTPTRTGYDFDGWFTSASEKSNPPSSVTSDIELYAHWTPKQFTVQFDANGGSEPNPKELTVTYDAAYGTLPTTARTGYTFDGWFTARDNDRQIQGTDVVTLTVDTTLYAHWSPLPFTVTLNANRGTVEPTQVIVYYDALYNLPSATRHGYTFDGWFTEIDKGSQITNSMTVNLLADTIFYAHWTPIQVKVTFHLNGGEKVTLENKLVTFDQPYGELPTATYTEHDFVGWFTEQDKGAQISPENIVQVISEQTLYAHWVPHPFHVHLDAQGGTLTPEVDEVTVFYGSPYGSLPTPERKGYIFDGWFTFLDSTSEKIDGNSIFSQKEDKTLYAHWTPRSFVITFDAGEGAVSPTSKTVRYDEPYGELPEASLRGKTFSDWYATPNGSAPVRSDSIVRLESDQTLYARWSPDPNMAAANFTVVNAQSLTPVSGATIHVDNADYQTDEYGQAHIILPIGKHSVSVSAPDCITREVTVKVKAGENQIPLIGISDKPLYEVKLSHKPMTLEEIKAAGIDVDAKENNHVYKYEMRLDFVPEIDWMSLCYYWTDHGDVYPGPTDGGGGGGGNGGGGGSYAIWIVDPPPPSDPERHRGHFYVPATEDQPSTTIYPISESFYLIIRGEIRWLKEMFDVQMLVVNNSNTDVMEDLTATLTLPEGLSLATMLEGQQEFSQKLDDLSGEEYALAHWYVRGDVAGSYSISAHLTGTIMPFEEPIDDLYVGENQLQVWAGDALRLNFEFPSAAYYADDYPITITLENVSDRTLYNLLHKVTIKEGMEFYYEDESSRKRIESKSGVESVKEFHPGDKLIMEFSVNIFFKSEMMEHEIEKLIGVVDGIEQLLNAYRAFSAVSDAIGDLKDWVTGSSDSIDAFLKLDGSGSSKTRLFGSLLTKLAKFDASYNQNFDDALSAVAKVTNSGVY